MHHVLVQPGHRNHCEHTRQKLLEEVALVIHIIEKEHTGKVIFGDGGYHAPETQFQIGGDVIDAQNHGYNQAECFQRIGPYQ